MSAPAAPRRPPLRRLLPAAVAGVALGGVLAAAGDRPATGPAPAPAKVATLRKDVGDLLASHCAACHNPTLKSGMLDLSPLEASIADGALGRDRLDLWKRVRARVAAQEMPPKDARVLDPAARERFLATLDRALEAAAPPPIPGDPGRVTLRRLNRLEYRNTIRDLLLVDDRSSDGFPSDDVGYGFDRIGDVLSLPPLLFEKYAEAAERIAEAAISDPTGPNAPARRFECEKLEAPKDGAHAEGGFVNFYTNAALVGEVKLPRDGEYEIRVRAFQDAAGDEPARLAWRVGDADVPSVEVKATKRRPDVVVGRFRGAAGTRAFSIAFVNDYYEPKNPDSSKRDRNLHVDWVEIAGPFGAAEDLPASHRRIFAADPGGKDVGARARALLGPLASRAWRRPVAGADLDRLVRLVEAEVKAGAPFEQGVRVALQGILLSPLFLFHVEVLKAPDDPRAIAPLDDYALASRLSYFLWSSMPDDALFARAKAGTLRRDLDAEVKRMLADPRAGSLVDGFAEQWLTLRRLAAASPDKDRFPTFDARLKEDMLRETQMFFETVMTEDRSVLDFVDGRFTFVNERLARHYGIEGVSGERFRRVPLDGERRAGIFTQASVLTVTSLPTRTSPVRRGKWLLEQVLGATIPPPPPGAGDLSDTEEAQKEASLRARTERHRRDPKCASCHERLDPLGFGLENYDAVGAWREQDGAFPVDASGTLPDGRSFRRPAELRAVLRADPGFPRGFAEKLFVYALGRGLADADAPTLRRIVEDAAARDLRFSAFVTGIVRSAAFGSARGEEPSR